MYVHYSDVVCPAGFSDHLTDQSSDKESGSGSQTDLRKIPSLPAPTDFLSNSGANSITKLMTPDAFMTPSASVRTHKLYVLLLCFLFINKQYRLYGSCLSFNIECSLQNSH